MVNLPIFARFESERLIFCDLKVKPKRERRRRRNRKKPRRKRKRRSTPRCQTLLSMPNELHALALLSLCSLIAPQVECDFVEKLDHYERLGVSRDASDKEIKVEARYKELG